MKKAVSSGIDEYLERKRALEERAKQIRSERANNRSAYEQASSERATVQNRMRGHIGLNEYSPPASAEPFMAPVSSQPSSRVSSAHSNAPSYSHSPSTSSIMPQHQPAPVQPAPQPAPAARASRYSQPAASTASSAAGAVSRAEYEAMAQKVSTLEQELKDQVHKYALFVEDTNNEMASLRQELMKLQKAVKTVATKPVTTSAPAPAPAAVASKPQPARAAPSYASASQDYEDDYTGSASSYASIHSQASAVQRKSSNPQPVMAPAAKPTPAPAQPLVNRQPVPASRAPAAEEIPIRTVNQQFSGHFAVQQQQQHNHMYHMQQQLQQQQQMHAQYYQQPQPQHHYQQHQDDEEEEEEQEDEEEEQEEEDQEQYDQDEDGADQERVPCKVCGRSFVRESLQRHAKICEKVFVKKRKPLQISRVPDEYKQELSQLQKKTSKAAPRASAASAASASGGAAGPAKIPKWKLERERLLAAVRAGREITEAEKSGKPLPPPVQTAPELDDRVPCPHCGRKFSESAAERHIGKCANIKSNKPSIKKR